VLILCFISPLGLAQQAEEVTLIVTVTDANKAVLPFAQISLVDRKGFQQIAVTNQQGAVVLANIPTGKYRLRVEAEHFEPRSQEIILKPGQLQITVRLEIARIKDEVVVSQNARERSLDPRSDTFTTILTAEQIANLPDDPAELKAELERMAGPGAVFLVDNFGGGRIPPKSQIRQIRFRRNSFAAEYHEISGVVVEILTKPSTSGWHGSLGYGGRPSTLQARNAFAPFRIPEGLQRFEASLDVPLQPGRTSLFLTADGKQAYDSKTVVAALPGGSFSDTVRIPSRNLYASARFNHLLSKTHDLRGNFTRIGTRNDNLGVGNFNLIERAFASTASDYRLQLAETGTIGKKVFHEFRLQLHWQDVELRSVNNLPGVIVLGAFNGGGAQVDSKKELAEWELHEDLDFAWRQHAMRAGVRLEGGAYQSLNLSNQGGTFTFSTLSDFRGGRPATFNQRTGIRPVSFSQRQLGGYWQDDWRVVPSFTLSYGVRYEWQKNLQDRNNYAPRLGIAWSPFKSGRTTIRGGVGVFYEWLTATTYGEVLSEDGQRGVNLVIRNPGFPNPYSGGLQIVLPPSRSQQAANLQNPYILQGSLQVQRQLLGNLTLLAGYSYYQGLHAFRGRNINAPLPSVGRPNPETGNVVELESTARTFSRVFNLTLNSGANSRLSWMIGYVYATRINEADGTLSLPADNFDLRSERGPASDDVRHRFTLTTGVGLLKGWRLVPTLYYNSASPYNLTTGRDNNGDTVFNDRPSGISRNSLRSAAYWNVNMRLSWLFGIGKVKESSQTDSRRVVVRAGDYGGIGDQLSTLEKKVRFNFYLQATNLLNRYNPTNFVGVMTSPFFRRPTAAAAARQLETGIKFSF
jgi:hypothetical protein